MTSWGSVYRRTLNKGEKFFDGIEANKATEGFTRYLDIPLIELKGGVNTALFTDFTPIYNDEMYLAESVQPTTNGLHVSITYQLSIKLIYDTYCAKEPECCIPLFIQAPELPNFEMVQAPEGWNPTTYDEVNFALPVPSNEMIQTQPMEEGFPLEGQGMAQPQIPIAQPQMQIEGQFPPPAPYGAPQSPAPYGAPQSPAPYGAPQNTQIPIQIPIQIPPAPVSVAQNQSEEYQPLVDTKNQWGN